MTALLFLLVMIFQSGDLTVEDLRTETRVGVFGQPEQIATGALINESDEPLRDLTLFAEVYNSANDLVGEGVGVLANACGISVPLDYVMGPGREQSFFVTLDLYDPDAEVDRVEILPQGFPAEDAPPPPDLADGITEISSREIASVEWLTNTTFRYGAGCFREFFATYDWFSYDVTSGDSETIDNHPAEFNLTETMLSLTDLADPATLERSYMSFPPMGRRFVYQNVLNTLISSEPDGSFRRVIDNNLFRDTLQRLRWVGDNTFIASYYGAFGEPVTYLIASTERGYLSSLRENSTPSVTVPGVTSDALLVIISGTLGLDETPGFYLRGARDGSLRRLFEYENLPGNNYPNPVWQNVGPGYEVDRIYLALPNDADEPRLFCFDMTSQTLTDIAPLPLRLGTEDQATMDISPEGTYITLRATGINGGLWLIDIDALNPCV